jgi:hypothetical protein
MKRYALFAGGEFYPACGWRDFKGAFDTLDEAVAAADEPEEDCVSGWWYCVADLETREIVAEENDIPSRWKASEPDEDPDPGRSLDPPSVDEPMEDEAFAEAIRPAPRYSDMPVKGPLTEGVVVNPESIARDEAEAGPTPGLDEFLRPLEG